MASDPGPKFFATFDEVIGRRLVEALASAYETSCEHHEPSRGSREQTFGFNTYWHAVHELKGAADELPERMQVRSETPLFRMCVGDYEMACHRVGRRASDNIAVSFPRNDGVLKGTVGEQLWLDGVDLRLDLARKVLLAHMGNPETGLESVYVCFPGTTSKGHITSWAYTHGLWIRPSAGLQPSSDTTVTAQIAQPPAEEQQPIISIRRKKKGRKDGTDGT